MFEKIKAAWRRWLHRRLWPVEWQLERLRSQVQEDRRWMGHDPKVAAVCDRYLEMLRPDWENAAIEPVSWFRSRIGCDPQWGAAEVGGDRLNELVQPTATRRACCRRLKRTVGQHN